MRIMIAAEDYYPNIDGSSYFSQRLAHYLKQKGHTILVIAPGRKTKSYFFSHDKINIFGVRSLPVLFYKGFRFGMPFLIQREIEKTTKQFRPDIVHIQGHLYICRAVTRIAKELGIPLIATNHFMPENILHYLHLPDTAENIAKKIAWKQFKNVFSKADIVTTPTKTAVHILKKIGLKNYIIPISCGIDFTIFNPRHNGEYLKEKYSIPNKKILLYVGRLDKEKNLNALIYAYNLMARQSDIHFVIAGIGKKRESLEMLSLKLGLKNRITFTGFVTNDDLPYLYAISHCFIIAGIVELQSIVTMEAMATGLPVIAVNALALPELVRHGENGFLFKLNDIRSIAEYIKKIFSDDGLRKQMSLKSLEFIKAHDISNTIHHYELLYRALTL